MVAQQTEVFAKSQELLIAEPGIKLALLYGSHASGKCRPDSDVDLAVLYAGPLDVGRRMALVGRLESSLGRSVDLVDLYAMSGSILHQVLSKGRILVKKDPVALAGIITKMIYSQADVMPLVLRTLEERQKRFVYG